MENLVIISSPLQALTVWFLLNSEASFNQQKVTVYVEGDYYIPRISGVRFININDTRGRNYAAIKNNLELIMRNVHSSSKLWISDLLWPMNNAVYSALLAKGTLDKVMFFDEGIILYWMERLSALRFTRELVKFSFLKHKTKVSFSAPSIRPFYGNSHNGEVFAFHPELLTSDHKVRSIRIDFDMVSRFNKALDEGDSDPDFIQWGVRAPAVLLLNQPYYRVSSKDKFRSLVVNATNRIMSMGYSDLYVKLHPSENVSVFLEFYKPLGYKSVLEGARLPIEAKLHAMLPNTALVSFNSSALLNATAFGFRGEVISYGLDWIAGQYRLQRSTILKHQQSLFNRVGVMTLLNDSSNG